MSRRPKRPGALAALLAVACLSSPAANAAGNPPPPSPPPLPRVEFTALFLLFPWASAVADMLDPIDINTIDILFDTIEDPDAFDNPAHG